MFVAEDASSSPRLSFIVPSAVGALVVIGLVLYLRSEPDAPRDVTDPTTAAAPGGDSPRSNRVEERLKKLREAHSENAANSPSGSQPSAGSDGVPSRGNLREVMPGRAGGAVPKPANPNAAHPVANADEPGQVLTDDDDPDDIPSLRRMAIEDSDPERRLAAVTLLGASDDPAAIPILAQALQDKDEEVRLSAIQSLADIGDDVPVDAIGGAALNDPSADNRYEALEVLSDVANPAARGFIEKAANDPDEDVADLAHSLLESDDSSDESAGEAHAAPPAMKK